MRNGLWVNKIIIKMEIDCAEYSFIYKTQYHKAQSTKQLKPPEFRSTSTACKIKILAKTDTDRFEKVHTLYIHLH